jgi:hypothetical protein
MARCPPGGVDLKASAMTNRRPKAVRSPVALGRLARGLGGVGLSVAWVAGVGAAGAAVSMRQAPTHRRRAPPQASAGRRPRQSRRVGWRSR